MVHQCGGFSLWLLVMPAMSLKAFLPLLLAELSTLDPLGQKGLWWCSLWSAGCSSVAESQWERWAIRLGAAGGCGLLGFCSLNESLGSPGRGLLASPTP